MNKSLAMGACALAGAVIGALAGFKYAEKKLGDEFDARLEKETAGMRTFYTNTPAKKYATPEEAAAALIPQEASDALKEYKTGAYMMTGDVALKIPYDKISYDKISISKESLTERPIEEAVSEEIAQSIKSNVFTAPKNIMKPYVISVEEYMTGDSGYIQDTLTWYGDSVLTDSREERVDDVSATVGEEFVTKFGHNSGDDNVVHVRNDRLHMDFEIVMSPSTYSREVLGVDEEESTVRDRMR